MDVVNPMKAEMAEQAPEGSSIQWLEQHSTADVTFTPDGTLLDYNSAAERMFMQPSGIRAHGESVRGFIVTPGRLDEAVRAVQLTGRLENWDCEFRRYDGSTLHAVVNLVGNFDSRRVLRSLRAHIFNVTEWRRGH
jgi:hypothetical protein